jgi:hypothetical protein
MEQSILKNIVVEILNNTPYKPFLCLPMSALLYSELKDNHQIESRLITGDLSYKQELLFKQDYSISEAKTDSFQYWSGHALVEIDNLICDLSIFRTLYSENFTKPCKAKIIDYFGKGRGCLIGTKETVTGLGLIYNAIFIT